MYAHFYQLSENPFNLTPDPKFHYINASTREAMASILHGIKARKGFITLIGEAGTGKTTLLKRILDEIEGETQIVFVFNPGVSFDELLEFICMELGVAADGGRRLQLLDKLNAYLLEQLTAGRNVVVMIDEAQTLDAGVLEELRLLSNLETSKEKILQILLSGQPELEDKLRKPNLRQLRQRIAVRATLKAMRPAEIGPYVETRLRSAGADRMDFFTPASLNKVWKASRGIPRVVNVICDNAMMIAFAEGKRRITGRVMAEAIRDLHVLGEGGAMEAVRAWLVSPAVRYAAVMVVGLMLALPFASSLLSGWTSDAGRVRDEQPPAASVARASDVAQSSPMTGSAGAERVPTAQEAADRAVETSESASSVDGGLAVSQSVRDSIRRAQIVARSTAARLYPSKEPSDDASRDVVGSQPAKPEERIVKLGDAGGPQNELPERLGTKLDDSALVSLQGPLQGKEEAAFVGASAPGAGGGEQSARGTGSVPTPKPPPTEAPQSAPVVEGGGSIAGIRPETGALGELKPVKAGAVSAPETSGETKPDSAPRAAAHTSGGLESAGQSKPAKAEATSGSMLSSASADRSLPVKPGVTPGAAAAAEQPASADAKAGAARQGAAYAGTANRTTAPTPAAGDGAGRAGLSQGQTDVASLEPETFRTLGPNADEPVIGQLVRVTAGDTLWDIAVAYYGTAGPATLTRILNGNPGISDPRHIDAGSHIYLPWQRPDQMVSEDSGGTYSVLLAVTPLESRLGPVRRWVEAIAPDRQLTISTVSEPERNYQLRLVGLPSREAALRLAADLLNRQPQPRRSGGRTA